MSSFAQQSAAFSTGIQLIIDLALPVSQQGLPPGGHTTRVTIFEEEYGILETQIPLESKNLRIDRPLVEVSLTSVSASL